MTIASGLADPIAESAYGLMRILFVSPFVPWPPNLGVALRIRSILEALERCGEVECIFLADQKQVDSVPTGTLPKVAKVLSAPDTAHIPFIGRLLRHLSAAEREWSLSYVPWFHRLYSWGSREIKATVSTEGYDLVFVARLSTMWWMGSGRAIPTLVDIDDVIHLGLQQALRSEKNPLRKLAKWWHYRIVRHAEVSTLRFVSKAFVCSEVDSEAVRSDKVAVLPNIFPDRGQLEREPVVSASPGLLFVGALVYKPNREAIAFFVRNIFPLIRETLPEATLTVVGRSGRDQAFEWARVSGITFLGTVRDIDPIIEASAVEVCPILYGAGTRIKILEALSFGKPVVSTTVGAHGIALDEESGLFRADSPEAFAERCITLLRSSGLRRDLAPRAREGVRSLYSQARVDRIVAETIQEVVCRRH